jgi:hypothetical protein
MAHETLIAGAWLQYRLSTDATLFPSSGMALLSGIYRRAAPKNAALPYLVWNWQGSRDENAAGGMAYSVPTVQVKIVSDDRMDSTLVETAINRVDALLTGFRGYYTSSSKTYSIAMQRSGVIDYAEQVQATYAYQHQGRLWEITVIECQSPV